MKNLIIREEKNSDYRNTEYMTMRAFWNMHGPGCNEHYLVHKVRESKDYLKELSRVAELDGRIVGAIFYTKAKIVDGKTNHEVLTFGPLCVEPTLHNSGIAKQLLEDTIPLAKAMGYPGIVIYGEPDYYPKRGFVNCEKYQITTPDGKNFDAFMAYPLDEEKFATIHGKFYESEVFEECEDLEDVTAFTKEFKYPKPLKLACQWLHEERLGQICEVQRNNYKIKFFEEEICAKLKDSFYDDDQEFPVVGDYVTFLYNHKGESLITSICERTSVLKCPEVMVSNFDYVFIVAALNDNYNFNRIARYVSITLQGSGISVVILIKTDSCSNPGKYVREIEELSDKVRVHTISAPYGIGEDELEEYIQPRKIIAVLDSSHTFNHRQMIELPNGAIIINAPGMEEPYCVY